MSNDIKLPGVWESTSKIESKRYNCGHCGSDITNNIGYAKKNTTVNPQRHDSHIYICHHCNKPTIFYSDKQIPSTQMGRVVNGVPTNIAELYEEIRNSTSVNAYSLAVMGARKLLMHIAVELGAEEGKKFVEYVDYIVDNHYSPPNSKPWVDQIRKVGNDTNHEIVLMKPDEAKAIIKYVEMLMVFNYELVAEAGFKPTEEPSEE